MHLHFTMNMALKTDVPQTVYRCALVFVILMLSGVDANNNKSVENGTGIIYIGSFFT